MTTRGAKGLCTDPTARFVASAVVLMVTVLARVASAEQESDGVMAERSRLLPNYRLGAWLGPDHLQLREDLLRPWVWSGGGVQLGFNLVRSSAEARQSLDLLLGADVVSNRYDHLGAAIAYGASVASLHRVLSRGSLGLWLGGTYRFETLVAYYAQWDDSFMYWLTSHSIAPTWGLSAAPLRGWELLATVEIPLVGVLSRPPTARDNKADPLTYPQHWPAYTHRELRWSHPGNWFAPTAALTLSRESRGPWTWSLRASASYRFSPIPRGVWALRNTLSVELSREL